VFSFRSSLLPIAFITPAIYMYSLRSIILFVSMDVFRRVLVIDISVLAKSNMGRREYIYSSKIAS
jgi:hypothetical protein